VRDICLARLDKVRPALVLTSPSMRGLLSNVTIAEITSTIRGLPTELLVGPANGLDRDSVVNLHNIHTVPVERVLHVVGVLPDGDEPALAHALRTAFALR